VLRSCGKRQRSSACTTDDIDALKIVDPGSVPGGERPNIRVAPLPWVSGSLNLAVSAHTPVLGALDVQALLGGASQPLLYPATGARGKLALSADPTYSALSAAASMRATTGASFGIGEIASAILRAHVRVFLLGGSSVSGNSYPNVPTSFSSPTPPATTVSLAPFSVAGSTSGTLNLVCHRRDQFEHTPQPLLAPDPPALGRSQFPALALARASARVAYRRAASLCSVGSSRRSQRRMRGLAAGRSRVDTQPSAQRLNTEWRVEPRFLLL
jgi:hypothetical protein